MFQFETAGPQHVAPDALPPSRLHFPPQSSCDEEGGIVHPEVWWTWKDSGSRAWPGLPQRAGQAISQPKHSYGEG